MKTRRQEDETIVFMSHRSGDDPINEGTRKPRPYNSIKDKEKTELIF
jgi:hypothetical protein